MNSALSCLVISDGRRGIENQVLGLAEAVARLRPLTIERKVISHGSVFKTALPRLQLALKSNPEDYGLAEPFPRVAIGCGRQAIAPLRALKKKRGTEVFTVFVQDPRFNTKHFDLVIAPEHDGLIGDNVFSIIGSPNRITNEHIIVDTLKFNKIIAPLETPRVTMLIGGNSKTHKLDEGSHAAHMQTAQTILAQGCSLLVTTSRRTPEFVTEAYQKLASHNVRVWFDDGSAENPFFAMLGASDAILVTNDSTNMLTEACASGKPVFTLPMTGTSGKFNHLYNRLAERCNVIPFTDTFEAPAYPPLNETARAAQDLLDRFVSNA